MTAYTRGEVRADGYIFCHYSEKQGPVWRSPEGTHRCAVARTLNQALRRSKVIGCPFNLDIEYLLSIYPKDGRCPVFGIELSWGDVGGRSNSPSLDRKDPNTGYVKGNVAFISHRANRIKSDATKPELESVLRYISQE